MMPNLVSKASEYLTAKKHAWQRYQNTHPSDRGASKINLLKEFPLFRPNMNGNYQDKVAIESQTIQNLFPFLSILSQTAGHPELPVMNCREFSRDAESGEAAQKLQQLFNTHGSDKSSLHDYHWLYGSILSNPESVRSILEIGLGSNNESVACNMGSGGRPGASIRAFRDFCEGAVIYGADIDRSILFTEDRIKTFEVDQTSSESFDRLLEMLPNNFDLVIDDGLHAPDANILTLSYGLKLIKSGGWVVIEDILDQSQPLWQSVAALLPSQIYDSYFIRAQSGMMFAVHRKV